MKTTPTNRTDWPAKIANMTAARQMAQAADVENLWNYPLPNAPAPKQAIERLLRTFQHGVPQDFLSFLEVANGWPQFFQSVDLFSSNQIHDPPRYVQVLEETWKLLPFPELNGSPIALSDLLLIGATEEDLDAFFLVVGPHPAFGSVLWMAGGPIECFSSFSDAFDEFLVLTRPE